MSETDPLTPADCDLRGMEPPWDAFTDLAVQTFGLSPEAAKARVDEVRRAYWANRATGNG
jgi:hypothetical protein